MEMTSTTIPITADNLPNGPRWDEDGACFTAEQCDMALVGCHWRWVPRNTLALQKGEPDKPLHDFRAHFRAHE